MGLQWSLRCGPRPGADFGAPRIRLQHAFEHADAGAQGRYYSNLLASDFLDRHRAAPALDIVGFQRQVFGGFIGQQGADFLSELTEILGADVGTAHKAEFMTDQQVADLEDGHGKGSGGGQKTGLD